MGADSFELRMVLMDRYTQEKLIGENRISESFKKKIIPIESGPIGFCYAQG